MFASRDDPPGAPPAEREAASRAFRRPTVSTRSNETLREGFQSWIRRNLPDASGAVVHEIKAPVGNGASSDTVLFDAEWGQGATERGSFAARMAPSSDTVAVFPTFDFAREAAVMRAVATSTTVPVPHVYGYDMQGVDTGVPFLLMEAVQGQVPPDYPPYAVGSWVTAGSDADLATLETSTVDVLAGLYHLDDPVAACPALLGTYRDNAPGLLADLRRWRTYYEWVTDGITIPLMDRAFRWLEEHLPAHESPVVLSWGDSRIGNIMYRHFRPVAVLDWEIAGLAPPEADLGYLIFMHEFLEDRIRQAGDEGRPDLLEPDRIEEMYRRATGYEARDREFYRIYASVRFASMAIRVSLRKVDFGALPPPRSPDDLIPHRDLMARMLGAKVASQ